MIFTLENAEKIRDGKKWETRRILIAGENGDIIYPGVAVSRFRRDGKRCLNWRVGQVYGIQPGRGKPSICRRRLVDIWAHDLQSITDEDIIAEGIRDPDPDIRRASFRALWDSIHNKRGERWEDNPPVIALRFEVG